MFISSGKAWYQTTKIISAGLVDVVFNHEVLNGGNVESNAYITLNTSFIIFWFIPHSQHHSDKAKCTIKLPSHTGKFPAVLSAATRQQLGVSTDFGGCHASACYLLSICLPRASCNACTFFFSNLMSHLHTYVNHQHCSLYIFTILFLSLSHLITITANVNYLGPEWL